MAQENWQKIKILKLLELLQQKTDEQHPLTTSEICSKMKDAGIPCDRRTLSKDIELLNAHGYEILWRWVGRQKGYYMADRSFSVPELKILIDAVQAATFVTESKTAELIAKIASLAGTHRGDVLKGNLVHFNTRKHRNESIYYSVDALEEALQQKKKVIFRYFDLDADRKKVYRREGHHYVVEPVSLVFNEDNYYLVAYSARHDNTANYRVDRMDSVELIDEGLSEKALQLRDEVGTYTEQAFKMYGGPSAAVVLEFDQKVIGAVYDRFGENTEIMDVGEGKYLSRLQVHLSPTFWGWLFQFGSQVRILSPGTAIAEYQRLAKEACRKE